jgi:glycosyltransferase involved in cell wall biosynthesis
MGGAAEIVDPSCGVLVPGRDAPALAATLQRLLDDAGTRRRLGAAGPARAAAVSDPARQLGRLASVAQSLAGARLP